MSIAREFVLRTGGLFFSVRIRFRKTSDSITLLTQSKRVDAASTIGVRLLPYPCLVSKS